MKPLRLLVCVVALLTLAAVPATGAPKQGIPGMKSVRYLATFELEGKSTWKRPPHNYLTDCYHRYWNSGDGEEVLSMKTRRPVRVLFYRPPGAMAGMIAGTWDPAEVLTSSGHKLGGKWTRRRVDRGWWESGECGGDSGEYPMGDDDCGTRLPNWLVHLTWGGDRRMNPQIGGDWSVGDRSQEDFDNCMAEYAQGLSLHSFTLRPQPLTQKQVFSRQPQIVLSESRSASSSAPPGARPSTVETSLRWKLTLRLVDKNGEPVPLPKKKKGKQRRRRG
jgi:hypothetical protein